MNKEEEDDDDDKNGVEDDAKIEDVVALATGVVEARAALVVDESIDGFCCGVDKFVLVCNNSFAASFPPPPSFWLSRVLLLLFLRGVASECATSRFDNTLLLRLSLTPMLIPLMLLEEASLFS